LAASLTASAFASDVRRIPRETDFYIGVGMSQNLADAFAVLVRRSGYACRTLIYAAPIPQYDAWNLICDRGHHAYQIRRAPDGGYDVIGD
jgi:hypothetical protein